MSQTPSLERRAEIASAWIEPCPAAHVRAVRGLAATLPRLVRHRDLFVAGVERDLAARFRGSFLGTSWTVLAPLCLFGAYGFVFAQFLGVRLGNGASGALLAAYMGSGAIAWACIANSISRAAPCIVEQRALIHRVAFPSDLLPLQIAAVESIVFTAALVPLALVLGFTRGVSIALIAAPILIVFQFLFASGLASLVAALHVFVRDTASALTVLLSVVMLATPVFWVRASVPGIERWSAWIDASQP